MSEILKNTLWFMGILLVGLAGVFIPTFMKAGDTNAPITTIDNIAGVR